MQHNLFSAMLIALAVIAAPSCSSSSNTPSEEEYTPSEAGTFAKGADVSWLTQLESEGAKFYTTSGKQKECMQLLRDDCGVEAIRLRVWVNPSDGWNSVSDVLAKARRANALGLRLMIDFHYSDTWADPGQQEIPAAWADMTIDEIEDALVSHTTEMLTALKNADITPEWVQIGNEVANGFLYPIAQADVNPQNFARLITAGHTAVKSVFPTTKTIVHLDRGDNNDLYKWLFDILTEHKASYDMIGMSLYPSSTAWKTAADNLLSNATYCKSRYNKDVMICETGMHYQKADEAYALLRYLIANGSSTLKGIFYWEPEAPAGTNGGYDMGCFDNGRPTHALDAFTYSK